jgi:hypothetical protein
VKLVFLLLISTATLYCTEQVKKPWTVLIYMAADNDLNKFAEPNIQQMIHAGSNDVRTILAYLAETKNQQKYGKLLRFEKNELIEIAHEPHADSGAQMTCLNACIKAFTDYPADHYALIFWDHEFSSATKSYNAQFYYLL